MGWTVLYIAFGIVALWLLGEVLLQYKARLRWRLLAFVGFLGVVLGVLMPSVIVIGIGAIAFAIGQTYVTLSFRRGFSTGWAIGGGPGSSRRRRDEEELEDGTEPEAAGPDDGAWPEDRGPAGGWDRPAGPVAAEQAKQPEQAGEVYQPQPMPDETGQYGVYSDSAYHRADTAAQSPFTTYGEYDQRDGDYAAQGGGYTDQYEYGTAQYAAYSDPYIGTGTGGAQGYDAYETYGGQQYTYGTGQYAADPYASGAPQQQYGETAGDDVWVPQQRDGRQQAQPEEQPYPYEQDYNSGYGEQYRY
ncbi:hypothetical protein ACH429_21595 [Streptomyces pathocidini]|uniref:Uncharacterized protein n=1 Tax=Streptomyces pathocidini TaxID=1650571 RepID=A0ABW7UZ25_9ACTN|nr:hypothetical protein [Streptomyces pathocidini]